MASYDPYLAVRRFGTGLPAGAALPEAPEALLAELSGPDTLAQRFAVPPASAYAELHSEILKFRRARRGIEDAQEIERLNTAARDRKTAAGVLRIEAVRARIARAVAAPIGFRERLELFWSDHFAVRTAGGAFGGEIEAFQQDAIRPHLSGRFGDMLRAVATAPVMLRYLDQVRSVGPASRIGKRRGLGLNENYARELLELHTLGAQASYTQADVTEVARLLAGLAVKDGFFEWQRNRAEPGAKQILGQVYGSDPAQLRDVFALLEDLATHPETAQHISRKLAVHFVSDTPSDALVAHMAARFLSADGDLMALYAAMLDHPDAWALPGNVKWPFEYLVSAIKALEVPTERILATSPRELRRGVFVPMRLMGQNYQSPPGPDGWAEADGAWITPQGIAGRIQWAMNTPRDLVEPLPDPRDFVLKALGPTPDAAVSFAAHNAESAREGIGIVLASAAFQRR